LAFMQGEMLSGKFNFENLAPGRVRDSGGLPDEGPMPVVRTSSAKRAEVCRPLRKRHARGGAGKMDGLFLAAGMGKHRRKLSRKKV